jgi:hypothetical protein
MPTVDPVTLADELCRFHGTAQYHRLTLAPKFLATDGVAHLAERAGAYWLAEAIASHQLRPAVRRRDFQLWRLRRTKGHRAVLEMGDDIERGTRKLIHRRADGSVQARPLVFQRIPFTDFPMDSTTLYVARGEDGTRILMLPSER